MRVHDQVSPPTLGAVSFILVAIGLTLVEFTGSNDWGTPTVALDLVVVGTGNCTLLMLLFHVLKSDSPRELAGEVGALRGVANNASSALGSEFAGGVAVRLIGVCITTAFNLADL